MKSRSNSLVLLLVAIALLFSVACNNEPYSGSKTPDSALSKIPESSIIDRSGFELGGKKYTRLKYRDKNGDVKGILVDGEGNEVDESTLVFPTASPISKGLDDLIGKTPSEMLEQEVDCKISFKIDVSYPDVSNQSVGCRSDGKCFGADGKELTQAELDAQQKAKKEADEKYAKDVKEKRREVLSLFSQRLNLNLSSSVIDDYANSNSGFKIKLKIKDIKGIVERNKDIIDAIDLDAPAVTSSLESAMKATSVSDYVLPNFENQGEGIGVYMTEPECSEMISTPNDSSIYKPGWGDRGRYKALGNTSCRAWHPLNVGSIIRAVSPRSFLYCRDGSVLPTPGDLRDASPSISVVNASFGWIRSDNDYHLEDKEWDDFVYDKSILAVVAAGNEGTTNGYLRSPARGINVLTVGNYDDRNSSINAGSSWVDPSVGYSKPELSAPGTNIDAGYTYSAGKDNEKVWATGTSQAAPHVAGIVADLIAAYPQLRRKPQLQKAFVIGAAQDAIRGGQDRVGVGGVDVRSSFASGWYYWWWEGSNGYFETADSQDSLPNNGFIDTFFHLNKGEKYRAVLVWLNRGVWMYNNASHVGGIGMDLDLSVYTPGGGYVGGSMSSKNGYEVVDFTASESGSYRFAVKRYRNNDRGARLRMALFVVSRGF